MLYCPTGKGSRPGSITGSQGGSLNERPKEGKTSKENGRPASVTEQMFPEGSSAERYVYKTCFIYKI